MVYLGLCPKVAILRPFHQQAGASYHRLVGQLGAALADFARVARRLQPAHSFDPARYDWCSAVPQGAQPGVSPNFDRVR